MHQSNKPVQRCSMLVSPYSPHIRIKNMRFKPSFAGYWYLAILAGFSFLFAGCGGTKVSAEAGDPQSAPGPPPQVVPPVKRGESVPAVLRSHISKTSFMTVAEL